MAQQAIRKMKRKQGRANPLLKGLAAAVGFTLIAVVVFALIIGFTHLSDGVIRIVNQLIKVAAIFVGVWAAVPRGSERAIGTGILIGLVYMGLGAALYALFAGSQLTVLTYGLDVLMGIAAGGLSGMIVGSLQGK